MHSILGDNHEGSLFSVLCIYQLGIIPATMSRQWLYLLFTQKLEVLDIVSSFIKTVHYVPGHALLADGLTVKSFFSN